MCDETGTFEVPYKNELTWLWPWLLKMLSSFEKHIVTRLRSWSDTLESLGETMEGTICLILGHTFLLIGTICFCECIWRSSDAFLHDAIDGVIAPSLSYPIISIPICLLVTLNLYMHYFYAVTISPGFLDDPPRDSVNSFLWARKSSLDKGENTMIQGASRSEKGVKITPASTAECQKCEKLRPEVNLLILFFYESCQTKLTVNPENSPLSKMQ